MIHFNEVPWDFEPRRKILPKLPKFVSPEGYEEPEMSEFDSAFLCGMLKTFRPKKILEVGIAGGATAAIILQALEDIGAPYEMHSIDASANFYREPSKPSGFMAMFAKEKLFGELRGTHTFHLGKYLPQVIDGIGGDIDFVILDTVHRLPGEGMDFIAMLPYLTKNALVILHDISLCHEQPNWAMCCATTTLFSAVTAEKFLNFTMDFNSTKFNYPNIGAFQINQQTRDNIENVFLSLILRWAYMPSQGELNLYLGHYKKHYPKELCAIYIEAIKMNLYNMMIAPYS